MLVLGGQRLRISLPALIFSGTLYCLAASAESLKDRNRRPSGGDAGKNPGDTYE